MNHGAFYMSEIHRLPAEFSFEHFVDAIRDLEMIMPSLFSSGFGLQPEQFNCDFISCFYPG
jgi:hypothetical protein